MVVEGGVEKEGAFKEGEKKDDLKRVKGEHS